MSGIGEIEKGVLSLSTEDELSTLLKMGIDSSFFVQYGEVFEYIVRYYQRYGKVPSKKVLKKKFDFHVVDINGEHNYYIDQLKECKVERELSDIIDSSIELIGKDANKALEYIAGRVIELQGTTQDQSHLSYTDKHATGRAEALADRMIKANQNLTLGIPTGLQILDSITGGWLPGQFASIIGRMGEGKSWLLMDFCVEAYNHGAKILFLSPEMTKTETELRFDTILSKRFRNTDLTLGKPTIDVVEYKAFLKELEKRNDWLTYDSVPGGKGFNLPSIQALVNLHKPDVLAIDGIPLITDEVSGSEGWQKMFGVCYGLKGIAVNYGIVVLSTSQANRNSTNYKGIPKLEDISYGEALAQAADKIISLRLVRPGRVKIGMPKNRGGKIIGEFYLNFDVDAGIIEQVLEDGEEITDEEVFGGEVFSTKDYGNA